MPVQILKYISKEPSQASAKPPLLILLHGVGSHEQDLFSLAPLLDQRFQIISARAPNTRGPNSYAWFQVAFTPNGPVIDPAQAEASRQQLLEFIPAVVAAHSADPAQVYLMGFSQGAIMSASVALSRPDLVAGAVLMSGRILPEIKPLIAKPEALEGLPILLVHGTRDTTLPIQHGRASKSLLESLPVALEYYEYPMGHEISEASLRDINHWLKGELDRHK